MNGRILFEENQIYEIISVMAYVNNGELSVEGTSFEDGRRYGLSYCVDQQGTKRIMGILNVYNEDALLRELENRFGSEDGDSRFASFCTLNGIPYKCYRI